MLEDLDGTYRDNEENIYHRLNGAWYKKEGESLVFLGRAVLHKENEVYLLVGLDEEDKQKVFGRGLERILAKRD